MIIYCLVSCILMRGLEESLRFQLSRNRKKKQESNLQKMVRPFILRRVKKDVLKDLPEKMEKNVYAVMEGEQKELYDAHAQRLKLMLSNQTEEEFSSSRIKSTV